jgi:hypothetical protein
MYKQLCSPGYFSVKQKALFIEAHQGLAWFLFIYLFICCSLGFELRTFTLSHSTSPFFVMGFFEIGSHKLFIQAGFEPQSS